MKKQKSKKKVNNGKLVILFSFLLIIVIALYAILNIGIFNSKNTVIKGNNYIDKDYIINLLEIKTDKNIFRYNINNMEKLLLNNRYIESVKIKRLLPNTIKISIVEKEISAILYNSDNMGVLPSVRASNGIISYVEIKINSKNKFLKMIF